MSALLQNQKEKTTEYVKFVAFKKIDQWWLTREFLKQYLTKNQNSCFQSGRLREVNAYEKWSLGES